MCVWTEVYFTYLKFGIGDDPNLVVDKKNASSTFFWKYISIWVDLRHKDSNNRFFCSSLEWVCLQTMSVLPGWRNNPEHDQTGHQPTTWGKNLYF